MLVDKKDIDILELYLYQNSISIEELVKDINITERSVRNRIENLNYVFQKSNSKMELAITKNKVVLKDKNKKLEEFIEKFELGNYNFNKDERVEIILFLSLILNDGFKFEMLEKILNVGKSTLKNDMKEVRTKLEKSGLSFISRPKKGLILTGSENIIRKLLLEYILKYFYIKSFNSLEAKNIINPVARLMKIWIENLKTKDIKIYFNFLKEIEKKINKIISDEGFEVLIIYLLIIHSPLKRIALTDDEILNEKFLKATDEYKLLDDVINNWNYKENKFTDSEPEKLKFIEYLLGTHSYNFDYSFYENWIQVETLVREIIKNVDDQLDVSIINDSILEDGLINHIRPTIYRIMNDIELKKLDIKEVIEKYNLLFNIVKKSLKPLEDYLGKTIEPEELAYLTIYFKLAIDRNKKNISRHISNILIVCNFGYGTSQLLVESLKEKYFLTIADVIPYNNFLNYDLKNIDLIISTINIEEKQSKIPVIKVSPLLGEDDEIKIKHYLNEKTYEEINLDKVIEIVERYSKIEDKENLEKDLEQYLNVKKKTKKENVKTLLEILSFENIKILPKVKNWQDGIKKSGEILLENKYIQEGYIKECTDIISQKGMYMLIGKNIILPHGSINKNILKTGMSFLKIENEVLFPEKTKIKYIVMLATQDKKEHINAFLQLKKIIDETDFLEKIDKITDQKELYNMIEEKFEKIKDKDFEILKYK